MNKPALILFFTLLLAVALQGAAVVLETNSIQLSPMRSDDEHADTTTEEHASAQTNIDAEHIHAEQVHAEHIHAEDEIDHDTVKPAAPPSNTAEPHVESISLTPSQIRNAGLLVSTAGPAQLAQKIPLFGVLSLPSDKQFRLNAPYPGLIEQVLVGVGDTVSKGQLLAKVRNNNTLQSYSLLAPAGGVVTQRWLNVGDLADSPLLEISDDQQLWVEMSVFPTDASLLQLAQPLQLQDLDQPQSTTVQTKVSYIAPQLSLGHITRARAVLNKAELPSHWRAGMHLQAWLTVAQQQVPVAVTQSALQQVDGNTVVFVLQDHQFIATPVEIGLIAPPYVEIRRGLAAGSRYVSQQSFVLKAELGKSSAGHSH